VLAILILLFSLMCLIAGQFSPRWRLRGAKTAVLLVLLNWVLTLLLDLAVSIW
jgi:hypothetical protein